MTLLVFLAHILGIAFLGLAGLITCLNIYIVFLRPFYFWLRRKKAKFTSVIPGLGTIFLVLAAPLLAVQPRIPHINLIALYCIALVVLDTGGIPWFVAIMFIQWLRGEKMWIKPDTKPPS